MRHVDALHCKEDSSVLLHLKELVMIVLYEVSQAKQAKEASTPEVSPRIRALESDRLPVLRACRHLSLIEDYSVECFQVLLVL